MWNCSDRRQLAARVRCRVAAATLALLAAAGAGLQELDLDEQGLLEERGVTLNALAAIDRKSVV